MSDYFSCDAPQAYRELFRTAKKDHKCCECGGVISIGETYQYASGIWDGSPDSFKTCRECCNLRDIFTSLPENDTACMGDLRGEISSSFYKEFGVDEYAKSSGMPIESLNKLFGVNK